MEKKSFPSLSKENLEGKIRLEQAYCHKPKGCYLARISIDFELSPLLPLIRPQVKALYFEPESGILIFKWPFEENFYKVSLTRDEIKIGIVRDRQEAGEVMADLLIFLSQVYAQRKELKPDYSPVQRPPALAIYKILPKSNCRECGELSCLAFAGKVSMAEAELTDCPHLSEETLKGLSL